ncbi:MAG: hypothetical protein U0804_16115 [Gemmataceae bacterium]
MPTLTIEYPTATERLLLEQAIAHVQGMNRLALTAAHGTVIAACEQLARTDGRKLLRDTLAAALQMRADATHAPQKSPAAATRAAPPAGS